MTLRSRRGVASAGLEFTHRGDPAVVNREAVGEETVEEVNEDVDHHGIPRPRALMWEIIGYKPANRAIKNPYPPSL